MKTNTKLAVAFLAAASSIAAQAADAPAAFTTSGNLAFTSDYVWRGISQNAGKFAVQGGFDASHSSGLSAGIWASNVTLTTASLEVDVYANYGFKLGALDASVGYIAYAYEGQSSLTSKKPTSPCPTPASPSRPPKGLPVTSTPATFTTKPTTATTSPPSRA